MRNDSPKTLVYAGAGSSHSWTWLADLFERTGLHDASFLGEDEFVGRLRDGADLAVISGGDGFAIAHSLSGNGFAELKGWIRNGGCYLGVCAGAYLPLSSSLEPFDQFNLVAERIENISSETCFEDASTRAAVRYGSCSIIHPVRGNLVLEYRNQRIVAPLFGGPVFKEPSSATTLLRYVGFTPGTVVQTDLTKARSIVLGKPAGIVATYGSGRLLLLGPHLEHPGAPEGNALLAEIVSGQRVLSGRLSSVARTKDDRLARAIADLKVACLGLENRSFISGFKSWDAERLLVLVAAIERRARSLGKGDVEAVRRHLETARSMMLSVASGDWHDREDAPRELVEAARICVDAHFSRLRAKG